MHQHPMGGRGLVVVVMVMMIEHTKAISNSSAGGVPGEHWVGRILWRTLSRHIAKCCELRIQ